MNSPDVKLLLRLKKEWLIIKAKELGLSTEGNKDVLATRIAKEEEQISSRYWRAIAGG